MKTTRGFAVYGKTKTEQATVRIQRSSEVGAPRAWLFLDDAPCKEHLGQHLAPSGYMNPQQDDQALETPSELGTHDRGWRFHRQFYECCHDYLRPDGQVWFLENSATDSEQISREVIAGNSALRLFRRYEARDDPGFVWMITERVCR